MFFFIILQADEKTSHEQLEKSGKSGNTKTKAVSNHTRRH